jgi:hypothetical protein
MDDGKIKASFYRAHAADAHKRAMDSKSPDERRVLLEMARTKEALADIFERRIRKRTQHADAPSK